MEGKKSFVLYCDLIHTVRKMKREDAGELFLHILQYVNDENPVTENVIVDLTFEPVKQHLKRDLVKYIGVQNKRSDAGYLGGIKSGEARRIKTEQNKANEALASLASKKEANEAVNVNVTVNDNDNVNGRKEDPPDFLENFMNELLQSQKWQDSFCKNCGVEPSQILSTLQHFNYHVVSMGKEQETSTLNDYKNYLTKWKLNKTGIDKKFEPEKAKILFTIIPQKS